LRSNSRARDEYLIRIELHSRLASDANLFSQVAEAASCRAAGISSGGRGVLSLDPRVPETRRRTLQPLALAACLMLIAGGGLTLWFKRSATRNGATSSAVAMLARAVDARWSGNSTRLRVGSALEPGWVRLQAGLAQVVFYSGARVVIEGPTELKLISPTEAVCVTGRLLAEVPPAARGFRVKTAQINVVDRGTAFGIDATRGQTEVHVFKGEVEFSSGRVTTQSLGEGRAAMAQGSAPLRLMAANTEAFASMFELQTRSLAAEAIRYDQWRVTSERVNRDRSLVLHFDFENLSDSDWTLRNAAEGNQSAPDGTIVGCQRAQGRWREKQALEFQSVNDRVRLEVPGDLQALTLSAWVCVKGLDRQFNSLFMCDGFERGTVHWLIRNDGVLGLTVIGPAPGKSQILASPPMLTVDKLGMWLHLAVVLDGPGRQAVQYVNGIAVSQHTLRVAPPFHLGSAELGNWNARGGSNPAPALIRNLSASLDEFELFNRALSEAEIHLLYAEGKPEADM